MTDIMHTFAWAFVNGDGFALADTDTGRFYIFGSEEEAQRAFGRMADDEHKADMHVALIACVPVNDRVEEIEELLGG